MNLDFLSNFDIIPADQVADMASTALTGDRINMEEYQSVLIVVNKGIGTAGQDPVLAVKQHTAATSGSSKALQTETVYSKLDAADITTVTEWTTNTQTAADTYTDATSAEKEGLMVIQVNAEQFDQENGYTYLSLDFASPGAGAQIIGVQYHTLGKRYKGETTNVQA